MSDDDKVNAVALDGAIVAKNTFASVLGPIEIIMGGVEGPLFSLN